MQPAGGLQLAAMGGRRRHVFKWYCAGRFDTIELETDAFDNIEGSRSVTWNTVRVGGWWSYEYDAGKDEARLYIVFNCRGDVEKEKEHKFVQVRGTTAYKIEGTAGRHSSVYDEVLLIAVEDENESAMRARLLRSIVEGR